jgi:hypothetical protein
MVFGDAGGYRHGGPSGPWEPLHLLLRHVRCLFTRWRVALSGQIIVSVAEFPGRLPWAVESRPFGLEKSERPPQPGVGQPFARFASFADQESLRCVLLWPLKSQIGNLDSKII